MEMASKQRPINEQESLLVVGMEEGGRDKECSRQRKYV